VNHSDAKLRRVIRPVDMDRFPILLYYPLFSLVQPKQNAHKGRFSRPVFTYQSVNLAAIKIY